MIALRANKLWTRRWRLGALLVTVMLAILAGCGASSDEDSLSPPETNRVTGSDGSDDSSEGLAFSDPADADSASQDDGSETTPKTSASGLPPVTTVPGPSGLGSMDAYTGVIGRLGPDQPVIDPAARPPAQTDGVMPLTGQLGDVPSRPAAVVKIDNGAAAVPQTGLNAADIVLEEEVEGGVTRFAAVFHSQASIIGPVRSGRTTDVGLISSLGSPLLLYSGANDLTETIIRRQPHIQNHSHSTSSGYWRDEARRAPSNLYTDTGPHWAGATGIAPPPQFAYRKAGDAVEGETATKFAVNYPASKASWEWTDDEWVRYQRGQRHDLVGGVPVSAANVVVIEAERVGTGMFDSAGGPVPEFVFVGQGPATVFTDGHRLEGVWTRPTLTSVATLTDATGKVIELTPGRTWIQLIGRDSGYLQ